MEAQIVPASVAKALIVWFEAPHALVMEDVCALYDWFHVDFPVPKRDPMDVGAQA